ncbi:hypothetical protein D3C71_1488310 [compost metagenome]
MRREEDGVQLLLGRFGVHVDFRIRRARREIDEAQSAVAVHDGGQLSVRRLDAGHVRACGEGADLEPPSPVSLQCGVQLPGVRGAAVAGRQDDHFADRLLPGQQIGMMLHMGDEDNRPLFRRQNGRAQPLGQPEPEQALELVDRSRRAVAA